MIEQRSNSKSELRTWRAIELFAGLGGFSVASPECEVVAAIDINDNARVCYEANFKHPFVVAEIGSLSASDIEAYQANLWWLSPPCQPYSQRGHQYDAGDRRAYSLQHLMGLIGELRPHSLALENVVGFAQSEMLADLLKHLQSLGYFVTHRLLCPTEMGWPNRRPRFYLLASDEPIAPWQSLPRHDTSLHELLESGGTAGHVHAEVTEDLFLDLEVASRYESALDRVDLADESDVSACFGSSYGKAIVRSGSYVVAGDGRLRRFTPREVALQLGLPPSFVLPSSLSRRAVWKLLGNSLSIPAVRYVMSHLWGEG